jgi:hypothetical protein
MLTKITSLAVVAGLLAAPVSAQSSNHSHVEGMTHADMQMSETDVVLPTEPGQGAFAAISEIVILLGADPSTDWSQVDITGLRDHLVDMDGLVSGSVVVVRDIPGGLEMLLDLGAPGNDAASRMVPAHAPFVQAQSGWDSAVVQDGDRLIWTVTSNAGETQIRALGFFGLMATGDHHRAHHLAMAKGGMMH